MFLADEGGGRAGGRGLSEGAERRELARLLGLVSELGLTVVFSLLIAALAGHYADRWLGTGGLLTALGAAAGLAGGLWRCYRRISSFLE